MSIIIEAPVNPLSLGQVSINVLKACWKNNLDIHLHTIENNFDLTAYQHYSKDFLQWMQQAREKFMRGYNNQSPHVKIWHLMGSYFWVPLNNQRYLISFHETDSLTPVEINIIRNIGKVLFTGGYTHEIAQENGLTNTDSINLGFDNESFFEKNVLPQDRINWFLGGKAEKRKNTYRLLKLWLSKYGVEEGKPYPNQPHFLHAVINNPFLQNPQLSQQHQALVAEAFNGRRYINVIFYPWLNSNLEYNDLMNNCHIDLTGLSGGESWNLPAFNMTCLGRWSIVLNATGHKAWGAPDNCVLVEPVSKKTSNDGIFFHDNFIFNQGNFYDWDDEQILEAFKEAEKRAFTKNEHGLLLGRKMTYDKVLQKIFSVLQF